MTARVLIVEDHVLVAVSLQLALSARGWEVETTDGPTAADVVDHARRFQPQSVLLDIDLGHGVGSGIDLIKPLARSVATSSCSPPRPAAPCSPRASSRARRVDRQGRLPRRGGRPLERRPRGDAAHRPRRP